MSRVKPQRLELINLISDKIDAYTANQNNFSTYAVTLALRHENPDKDIRHDDVKEIVNSFWDHGDMDDCEREANGAYWLYKPKGIATS